MFLLTFSFSSAFLYVQCTLVRFYCFFIITFSTYKIIIIIIIIKGIFLVLLYVWQILVHHSLLSKTI